MDEKIISQYFKDAGYTTALIGKWLLGFYQQQYTPTNRGFDSFFGHLGILIDYFDFTHKMFDRNFSRGHDLRRNFEVANDMGYATELFTSEAVRTIQKHDKSKPLFLLLNHLATHTGNEDFPLQAPQEEIDKFSYISDPRRRTLAGQKCFFIRLEFDFQFHFTAMVSILDKGVGAVVKALKDSGMLENTVVVFYSDNGGLTTGPKSSSASNHPLRGVKNFKFDFFLNFLIQNVNSKKIPDGTAL